MNYNDFPASASFILFYKQTEILTVWKNLKETFVIVIYGSHFHSSPAGNVPTPCSCTCLPLLSRCPWSTGALRWRWTPTLKTASVSPGGTSQRVQTQMGSGASVRRHKACFIFVYCKYIFQQIPKAPVPHQVWVQVEGCGQMASIVLLCRPAIHHEETYPILKKKKKKKSSFLTSSFFLKLTGQTWEQLIISHSKCHWPAVAGLPAGFQGQTQGGTMPDWGQCPPLWEPPNCYQTDSDSSTETDKGKQTMRFF